MKKLLSIACATGILMTGLASLASASDTNWFFKFEGSTASDGIFSRGSTAFASSSTAAGVTDSESVKDPKDSGNPASAMDPVIVSAWYRPGWDQGLGAPPWAFLTDTRTPLGTGPVEPGQSDNYVKTWHDLIVWTTPGFAITESPKIYLHVTPGATTQLPPSTLGGHSIIYKLVMTAHPTSYNGPTEWILPTNAKTVIELPSAGTTAANPITGTGPLTGEQVAGYRFNFVTPEPGSILVLASGLTGLVGLIRRRKV